MRNLAGRILLILFILRLILKPNSTLLSDKRLCKYQRFLGRGISYWLNPRQFKYIYYCRETYRYTPS